MSIIEFRNVTKYYPNYHHIKGGIKWFLFNLPSALSQLKNHRFQVLNNLSFEIKEGEPFGIIGKNGAGKSTMLGLIAGVLKPSSGEVIVKKKVVPLLELGAGFHPDLTGRENIILNGVLLGIRRSEMMLRINSVIEFSELGQFIDQPVRTYSSGMLTRLGFSVAVHTDPEILLIDEILAVGDLYFQQKCKETIKKFSQKGTTIVLVTHSTEDMRDVCKRALWLDSGTAKKIGSPEEISQAYLKYLGFS